MLAIHSGNACKFLLSTKDKNFNLSKPHTAGLTADTQPVKFNVPNDLNLPIVSGRLISKGCLFLLMNENETRSLGNVSKNSSNP